LLQIHNQTALGNGQIELSTMSKGERMTAITEELLTTDQVAKILGMKPQTIRTWCFYRKVPFLKLGKSVRFEPSVVRELIERSRAGGF
jgi:excisionase family DNA binding protein